MRLLCYVCSLMRFSALFSLGGEVTLQGQQHNQPVLGRSDFALVFCSCFKNRFVVRRGKAARRNIQSQLSCFQSSGTKTQFSAPCTGLVLRDSSSPFFQSHPFHWQLSDGELKEKLWEIDLKRGSSLRGTGEYLFYLALPGAADTRGIQIGLYC